MSKPVIICVDDETMVLESLNIELKKAVGDKYLIETAESGEDALELFEELQEDEEEVALVISDHIMPGMKGDELLRKIHEISPGTLKIMLTGLADLEAVGNAIRHANLYRYIAKPWQPDDLKLTVAEAVHSYLREKKLAEQHETLLLMNRELAQLNTSLEQKVAERTAELEQEVIERKQAEAAAKVADQAKSAFLANMSHELRTPLNGILGYAHILMQNRELSMTQQKGLNIICQSGNHLLTLINDILDLSKIEARKVELCPAEVSFPGFLESIVGIIRMRARQKNVRFAYEADEHLPAGIKADEKRLRQVLLNLLGNAVKFTDSRGSVTLRVSVVSDTNLQFIDGQIANSFHFEVEDTGVGMTSEQLKKIFLPFKQVGDAQRRAEGTGLGLAISRQLVRLMGSEIQVRSGPGRGSTFWFEAAFPVIDTIPKDRYAARTDIVGYEGERRRALVIDDNQENRLMLHDLLDPLGFEVALAENGQEGVAEALGIRPDFILTDLIMPVMTGFEAVRKIRQIPEIQDVPVIAISASAFEADQTRSQMAGCDAFLPKPVDVEKLFDLLEKHAGVEWIYEESEERAGEKAAAGDATIAPPQDDLEILYELAMSGSMDRIQERALYLEEKDEKYVPFAGKLCELARNFEDEQILALVEQSMEEKVWNVELRNASILIIDDNAADVSVILDYLKKYGFETITARNGKTGFKRAKFSRPDLILLDVMMPDMDGFETCRLLKSDDATREIPVIFMTVLSDTVDKVRGFEVGGTDYITKPFQTEELLVRVKTHLSLRKLQQQLRERNVFLEKIDTIVRAINSEVDLTELLETILKESFVIRGVERAFALIYDKPLNAYTYKASIGADVIDLRHVQMSLSEAEERYIRDSKEIEEDIFIVEQVSGRPGEAKFRHIGIAKSMLIFRIRIDRHTEGYLVLCNMNKEHAFEEQDIRLLKNLKDDISSAFVRSRLLSELEEMSLTDTLTGMRNRRYLLKVINMDIANVHQDYQEWFLKKTENPPVNSDIVFLMLDMDHFKSVNDTYGHDAGDQVLVQASEIIKNACRDTDIPVRWGGEEFLLVIRHCGRRHAQMIAERLRKQIKANPFDIGTGQIIHLTCSIGLASYPFSPPQSGGLNWEQVVAVADKALYAAKMAGRDAWVCIMGTEQTTPERLFERIQDNIGLLICSGEIHIRTSVPDAGELVFQ